MPYLELGKVNHQKQSSLRFQLQEETKMNPNPSPSFFSLLTIYNVSFFLSPGYPEKNPLSEKMEINPGSIWILADNKVKKNDSWVPIG